MFVIHVTIDSFVVVVYRRYCCYNFLDKCKQSDGDGFDDGGVVMNCKKSMENVIVLKEEKEN